jgi:hypothetical protein
MVRSRAIGMAGLPRLEARRLAGRSPSTNPARARCHLNKRPPSAPEARPPRSAESRRARDAASSGGSWKGAALAPVLPQSPRSDRRRPARRFARRQNCERWVVPLTTSSQEECGESPRVSRPVYGAATRPTRSEVEPHRALVPRFAARTDDSERVTWSGPAAESTILAPMSSFFRRLGSCVALSLAAAGCARQYSDALETAPPGAAAPVPPSPAEKQRELDALERDLTVSEQRLAGYLAGRSSELRSEVSEDEAARGREEGETSKATGAPAPERRTPAAQKPKKADDRPAESHAAAAPASPPAPEPGSGSACDLACQALSSMRRSAERICSIAGESDPRCARARARVEDAVGRVSRASCACREHD